MDILEQALIRTRYDKAFFRKLRITQLDRDWETQLFNRTYPDWSFLPLSYERLRNTMNGHLWAAIDRLPSDGMLRRHARQVKNHLQR